MDRTERRHGAALSPDELRSRYTHETDELTDLFEGVFTRDEVTEAMDIARAHLERQATVTDFLPLLVPRLAREELLANAQAQGRIAKPLPEILFVSEHNSARSHMAAAITRHLADGTVNVRCAGVHPRGGLDPAIVEVLAERGIVLKHRYPMPLTAGVVGAADIVVTLGVPPQVDGFTGKDWVYWDIPPVVGQGRQAIARVADDLTERARRLLIDHGIRMGSRAAA